jgi:site-specific recombinase XerD
MKIDYLVQAFCEYALHMKGQSPETIRKYKSTIKSLCRAESIEDIEQFTLDVLRHFFYYGRMERKWTTLTFIGYHAALSVFARWCVERAYLADNPLTYIELPRAEHRVRTKFTKQDALRLLECIYNFPYQSDFQRYRNHAIFSTFIFAGLRKKELLHLRFMDVDLENLTLFINQGKGNKDRLIPISFTLAQSLRAYVEERRKMKKTCPEFFTPEWRDNGLSVEAMEELVRRIQKRTGLTFGCHKLRHTFATLMIEGGCDIYSLSKMMGHTDIKTTTVYLSASAEHLRQQISKHPLDISRGLRLN